MLSSVNIVFISQHEGHKSRVGTATRLLEIKYRPAPETGSAPEHPPRVFGAGVWVHSEFRVRDDIPNAGAKCPKHPPQTPGKVCPKHPAKFSLAKFAPRLGPCPVCASSHQPPLSHQFEILTFFQKFIFAPRVGLLLKLRAALLGGSTKVSPRSENYSIGLFAIVGVS